MKLGLFLGMIAFYLVVGYHILATVVPYFPKGY